MPRRLRRLMRLAFLLAMLLAASGAHAAVDMFLEAGNIKGESEDRDFSQAIEVLAWSWGMSQSGSTHVGGGAGAGKANFQDLSLTKYIDTATTPLMQKLASGSLIPEVKLTVRKAGQRQAVNLKITLKTVLVTSISTGGSGGEDRLTENVTFNFAEVKVEYFTPDGKPAGVFNWSIVENKVP